jgi:hypothetical protein
MSTRPAVATSIKVQNDPVARACVSWVTQSL